MKTKKYLLYLLPLMVLVVVRCANPGTPMGGPKDETPPTIKKSTPLPNAMGYNKKEISIEFDELIQLKDVNQKLVVSPPLNKQPSVVARGNQLLVVFDEDLQENTTYTLDFADAVADNNEGNIIENFRFSFSTGQIVDSLSISGHLFQADDLSPISGALVFIHSNLTDTALQTLVPVRLAKTDSKGRFSIQNVSPGNYKIYALEDANRNYKYDQPGERIAWLDSLVVPSYEYRTVTDSIAPDSTATREVLAYTPDSLKLFLFAEDHPIQYITGDARKERARIDIQFKRKVEQFDIQPIDFNPLPNWLIKEQSLAGDSISLWITDSEIQQKDTIKLNLNYLTIDSLSLPIIKHDTLSFYYFETTDKRKPKSDEKTIAPSLAFNELRNTIDLFGSLSFSLPAAPVWYNSEGLKLYQVKDSVKTPKEFQFMQDSLNIRRFRLTAGWEAGTAFDLEVDSASFKDVYGQTNKKVVHKFNIKPLDSYGTAYITILNPQPNWILQITDTKEKVIRSTKVPVSGKIAVRYLAPGEFMVRILVDTNLNGIWDTGNLKENQQPETILYYPEKLSIRANWEHEVKWDPSTFNIYQFSEKFRKAKKQGDRR